MPHISCHLNLEPGVSHDLETGQKSAFVEFEIVDASSRSLMPFDLVELVDLENLLLQLPSLRSGEGVLISTNQDFNRKVNANTNGRGLTLQGFSSDGQECEIEIQMTGDDWDELESAAREALSLL